MAEIAHTQGETKGSFYVEENGERLAEMVYSRAGNDKIIIEHTEVSEKLAGKGIGKQMVAAAVEYARENDIRIMPLCPFAKAVFEKVETFRDVLYR